MRQVPRSVSFVASIATADYGWQQQPLHVGAIAFATTVRSIPLRNLMYVKGVVKALFAVTPADATGSWKRNAHSYTEKQRKEGRVPLHSIKKTIFSKISVVIISIDWPQTVRYSGPSSRP